MSKKTFSYCISVLIGIFFFAQTDLRAQNDLSSEEALKKEAQRSFDDEDFGAALKFYSRLLSVNIKDPLYNYRYGVCLLNASADKDEAVKFLEKASKDPNQEKEVFYYYGKALQLNYRFNDAIAAFVKYKSQVSESKAKKMQVDHLIETCSNGKNLLRHITDLQVVDKKELNDKEFFLSYDLTDIGGRLLVKPDEFKTALDKKKKESSIIYLSADKSEIYFSSYGNSDENGKDIYVIKRLPDGEYGKPVSLGHPINTEYDEDYPFLHPNGKVLYFASKGHNSMGGYDIFKSERNLETGVWGKPVNLDFAINTPDDDILFVTDLDEKTAYFASRRGTENGKLDVYRINTQRKPVDICIFKGKYSPRKEGDSKTAKITVKNVDINEVEGVFKSAESDGEYTLNLPNGGKYLITVETHDGDIQSDMLIIPQQFETVPIRQEITYAESENGKMHLKTFFGQNTPDDDRYSLAVDFIKERSKLDVNVSKDMKDSSPLVAEKDTLKGSDTTTVASAKKSKNLSNDDLIHIAEQDAKDLEKEAKDARDAADKALVIVNDKNQKAQEANKKVEDATSAAAAATTPEQKQIEEARADALQVLANAAGTEATSANNFYKNLDADAAKKQKEAGLATQYAADLQVAIKSKSKDAMARLDAQKEALDKMSDSKSGAEDIVASIQKDADAKHKEVVAARTESVKIKDDIKGIEVEITNLNREAAETKNDQLKTGITAQVDELKREIKTKEGDLTVNDLKLGKLQKEAENLNNEAYLVYQMNEKIKSGQVTASSEPIDKEKLDEQISTYHPKDLKHASSYDNTVAATDSSNQAQAVKHPDVAVKENASVKDSSPAINSNEPAISSEEKLINEKYNALIVTADSKTSPSEKEQAKADGYKQWSDALTIPIEDKKEDLKKATDPAVQEKLKKEIGNLESDQQEKRGLAKSSQEKAETLKSTEPVLSATVKSTKPDSGQTSITKAIASEPVNTNIDPAVTPKGIQAAVDSKFNRQTAATDTISKPVDKAIAKAAIYKNWATAIEQDASGKKKELEITTDKDRQNLLKKEIAELETDATDKRKMEQESLASADRMKKEDVKTSPEDVKRTEYANSYATRLAANDNEQKPGVAKDSSQAVLYNKWADAISNDISTRKKNLATITDPAQRNKEEQKIADLQSDLAGKQAVAQKLTAHASKAKQDLASASAQKEPGIQATDAASLSPRPASPERTKLETESVSLKTKADSVYTVAMKLQGDDRAAKLKESNDLEKESREKQTSALAVTAKVNENNFDENHRKIVQYASQPDAATRPGLAQADSLNSESRTYFDKAKKLRDAAASNKSYYAKQEDLKSAEENEQIALAKQDKALQLYSASYPALKTTDGALAVNAGSNPELKTTADVKENTVPKDTNQASNPEVKTNTDHKEATAPKDSNVSGNPVVKTNTDPKETVLPKDKNMNLSAKTNPDSLAVTKNKELKTNENPVVTHSAGPNTDTARTSTSVVVSHTPVIDKNATEPSHTDTLGSVSTTFDNSKEQKDREEAIRKSAGYKRYMKLRAEIDIQQTLVRADNKNADAFQLKAQSSMAESDVLIKAADAQKDSVTRKTDLKKAKKYEDLAAKDFYKADSSRYHARQLNEAAISKRQESNDLLAAMDSSTRASVLALNAKESDPFATASASAKTKKNPAHPNASGADKSKNPKDTNPVAAKTAKNPKDPNPASAKTTKTSKDSSAVAAKTGKDGKPVTAKTTKAQKDANAVSGNPAKTTNDGSPVASKSKKDANAIDANPAKTTKDGAPVASKTTKSPKDANAVTPKTAKNKKDTTPAVAKDGKTNNIPDASTAAQPVLKDQPLTGPAKEIFVINPKAPADKKIPIDKELPEGILYKVQIGAFRNAISPAIFKGMNPLTGETTPQGYIRYTAGIFTSFESADKAKDAIHALGFKDAFVVAFYNGKRLPVSDAVAKEKNPSAEIAAAVTHDNPAGFPNPIPKKKKEKETSADGSVTGPATDSATAKTKDLVPADVNNALPVISTELPKEIAKTSDVTNVKGLFYTVQVGVYSKPVSNEKLFGIQPLNTERMANGTLRYTTGQYTDVAKATAARNKIIETGVKDAFVIAYYNGQRLSVDQAQSGILPAAQTPVQPSVEKESTNPVAPIHSEKASNPSKGNSNTVPSANVVPDASPSDFSKYDTKVIENEKSDTGVIYKVQIGAFKEQVPIEIANKFLLFARRGVSNFKDENGNTVFTIGVVRKYEDAQFLKEEAAAKGISDAFILAFKNGKKVPVSEVKGN